MVNPNLPQLGVQAVLDMQQFNRSFQQYQQSITRLESSINRLTKLREAADKRRADQVKQSENSIAMALQKTRREMLTVLFFVGMLERGWTQAWGAMELAATQGAERMGIRALARRLETDLGSTAEAIRELANDSMSTQEAMQVVLQGMLVDQGQFSDQYAKLWQAARVAAVTGMAEADEAFKAFVTDLVEGTGKATDAISPIYGVQSALESYASASGRTVQELSHQEAAHVTLQQIYKETGYLLEEGAGAALEYADAWNRVQARMNELKEVSGIFASDSGILRTIERLATYATQAISMLGAGIATLRDSIRAGATEFTGTTFWGEIFGAMRGDPSEAFSKNMQRYADALGLFRDEVDKRGMDYDTLRPEEGKEVDYSPIVDHLMKREQLITDHTHRVEKIWDRYYDRIETAELRYQQAIDRAHRMADRDRERAQRNYDRQRRRQIEDNNRKIRKLEDEHNLRLEQNQREFRLRSLQSEALYQYERSLAVATGDVLGIEDLDARYKLETEAREQNFKEQQRQETENFELRRRYMREEMDEQLAYLKQNLDDQLEEIRIREEERIAEAAERRKEEYARAAKAREQQLEDEARQHARSLEQWNQYWIKLGKRFELGLSDITQIIAHFFGHGSEFDSIMEGFTSKWTQYMTQLNQLIQRISTLRKGVAAPMGTLAGGGIVSFLPTVSSPRQYGGSMIASRPSMIPVGEGHMPEMISVRPMSPISTLKLSWTGGPIPVSGSGMEGADTTGLGDAIAQGLLTALQKSVVRTGATYG